MDPFLELIRLLRPQATLWGGGIEASGRWGVSFPKRDDLLFCWVQRGGCLLVCSFGDPLQLQTDDFVLVRTSESFTLTSDVSLAPVDSAIAVANARDRALKLGEGSDSPVTLRGGRFVFDTANEGLLTGLLPSLVRVAAEDISSWRVRSLLKMNETESLRPGPGSEFVVGRLMELILVEILRGESLETGAAASGLLAGLADPITARALYEMHSQVARRWTVSSLAGICNVSRSTFATRFRNIMGIGPIEYLMRWRIALAKDALRRGTPSIGEIAFAIGFQSSSAFNTAFRRTVGCSPGRFATESYFPSD